MNPTAHDATFKSFLPHLETARDFLQLHLPPAFLQLCDMETLKLESGSFVEDDLRASYSDVLYSLQTAKGNAYVYCLIEHQSSPDKHMTFRLMRYALSAMQQHLDAGHTRLPLVVPILFYTGKRTPYPYSMNWLQEFANPELANQLYTQDFPLVDVTVIPDDEIMKHRRMAILTLLQKHIRQRSLAELLDKLVSLLLQNQMTRQQFQVLISYMLQRGQTPDARAFIHELAQRVPKHGDELMMTIAQQLEQIGLEKGRQEGMQLGQEKGRLEGKLDVARTMLKSGIERATVMQMTGLSEEDLQQINH